MLTAKKFAEEIGKPYSTVALWLKLGRIPEATAQELDGDKVLYLIPASASAKYQQPENQPKRGRPVLARLTSKELFDKISGLVESLGKELNIKIKYAPRNAEPKAGKWLWFKESGQVRFVAHLEGAPRYSAWINVVYLQSGDKTEDEVKGEMREAVEELMAPPETETKPAKKRAAEKAKA